MTAPSNDPSQGPQLPPPQWGAPPPYGQPQAPPPQWPAPPAHGQPPVAPPGAANLRGSKSKAYVPGVLAGVALLIMSVIRVTRSTDSLGAGGAAVTVIATLAVVGVLAVYVLRRTSSSKSAARAMLAQQGMGFTMEAFIDRPSLARFGGWQGRQHRFNSTPVNCLLGSDGRSLVVVPLRATKRKAGAIPFRIDLARVVGSEKGTVPVANRVYPALVLNVLANGPEPLDLFLARSSWEKSGIATSPLARFAVV